MKTILITVVLAACAALGGAAMPTKEESERAEPLVRKLMASERAALESGKKTRAQVAAAAMKLADEADTEAAKLLLMKGAFVLYVRDGNLEKAVKTMNTIEKAIADVPPQCVTNMIETALLGVSKKEDGGRLYRLLDETKENVGEASPPPHDGEVVQRQATVGGYTWSYRVNNGEAAIVAVKDGKFSCAVSPSPEGVVTIPSTLGGKRVTHIGQSAFKGCSGMSSVTIPSDVKDIGPWAFEGCSGLTSMAIPDGVKTIENCVFAGCGGLKSVMIPSSVTTISDAAFIDCGGLTSITIPPTVKEIRTQVFWGCGNLKSVTIPASVEKIGWASFIYSGELKEISVEPGNQWFTSVDGVLYTKDMTELVACPNALTSLTIPSSVKKLRDAAIISCGKLDSLTIPEGVTDIGWQAIKDCCSLKTVTIPSTVRSIAEIAFYNCGSLTSVTIPEGVASIGKRAFENCVALTSVTMCGERPEASDDVFKGCGNLKAIHVPANAKSWAGMKEWQGIPLVFDGKDTAAASKVDTPTQEKISVAQKLESCDFLLNKDFKKNAKYYLCLFSASWCGPCRREMPRIAKMYAETLKADPDIELIHFSCDQNDEKALAWAKEQGVKFPVVKPKGGNPLNLKSRGIPHLFIVKADGTLVEEGHPAKLFIEEKLSELK